MREGQSFGDAVSNINYKSVGVSVVGGAVGAGIAGKVSQLGKISGKLINMAVDATESASSQLALSGEVDLGAVGVDVLMGATVGDIAAVQGSTAAAKSETGQALQRTEKRLERVNRNNPNSSRAAAAKAAHQNSLNFKEGYGAVAGDAAAKSASTVASSQNDYED